MQQETYPYTNILPRRYTFVSEGRKQIIKIVEFTPVGYENIFNLGFGDMLSETKFDDLTVSDNGDIRKVITTVIKIVQEFSEEWPDSTIAFTGSTVERTKLYGRILKMYYAEFSKMFHISGFANQGSTVIEVDFDPNIFREYIVFFVKRKF